MTMTQEANFQLCLNVLMEVLDISVNRSKSVAWNIYTPPTYRDKQWVCYENKKLRLLDKQNAEDAELIREFDNFEKIAILINEEYDRQHPEKNPDPEFFNLDMSTDRFIEEINCILMEAKYNGIGFYGKIEAFNGESYLPCKLRKFKRYITPVSLALIENSFHGFCRYFEGWNKEG